MTDQQAERVCRAIREYLQGHRGFDTGQGGHFDALAGGLKTDLHEALRGVREDDLRMVAAIGVLRPKAALFPPPGVREGLSGILRAFAPDTETRAARAMEFAIAYGCGRWPSEAPEGWRQPWEGAVQALARTVEPAGGESNRWLEQTVVGFPEGRGAPASPGLSRSSEVWRDAHFLAMRLIRPAHLLSLEQGEELKIECVPEGTEVTGPLRPLTNGGIARYSNLVPPGAKDVFSVEGRPARLRGAKGALSLAEGARVILTARDEEARIEVHEEGRVQRSRLPAGGGACIQGPVTLAVWECACGHHLCAERHRLGAWRPEQVSLWAFVASAVKGPQPRIQAGSLVKGMYFPLLAREGL